MRWVKLSCRDEETGGATERLAQADDSNATELTSRRKFIGGAVLFGAALAPAVAMPTSAHAGWFRRWRRRWRRRRRRRNTACFLSGSKIKTPNGYVTIDDLRIGDMVETGSGQAMPIKWIGHARRDRTVGGLWHKDVAPIEIREAAIDEGAPDRTLYVSPYHGILVDGLLIPAIDLVNGTTIVQQRSFEADEILYLHIELDSHEVVVANGLESESFRTWEDRSGFDNFDQYVAMYGDAQSNVVPIAEIVPPKRRRDKLQSIVRFVTGSGRNEKPSDIVREKIAKRAAESLAA